ncbi:MAG: hypothetical protein Q4D04_11900 [Clostridia bacterium]|nr:hypothetical protein [Clostridia bacterium]
MKLYNIEKPENLFKELDSCKGKVGIVLPDGTQCDWSDKGTFVKSLWKAMPNRIDNVEVKLSDNEDTVRLIDFLMRGNCA